MSLKEKIKSLNNPVVDSLIFAKRFLLDKDRMLKNLFEE